MGALLEDDSRRLCGVSAGTLAHGSAAHILHRDIVQPGRLWRTSVSSLLFLGNAAGGLWVCDGGETPQSTPLLAPMTSQQARVTHQISGRDRSNVQFVVHHRSLSQPSTTPKSARRKRPARHRTVTFSVKGSLQPTVDTMAQSPLLESQDSFDDPPPLIPGPDELDDPSLFNEMPELAETGSGRKVSLIDILALIILDSPLLYRLRICTSHRGWLSLPRTISIRCTIARRPPALVFATNVTTKLWLFIAVSRVITRAYSAPRVSFRPIVASPPIVLRSGTREFGPRSLSLTSDSSYVLAIAGQLARRTTIRPKSLLATNTASPVSAFSTALILRRRQRHFSYCQSGFSLARISILAPPLRFHSLRLTIFSSRSAGLRLTSSILFSSACQNRDFLRM
jgi:hypothetical protein